MLPNLTSLNLLQRVNQYPAVFHCYRLHKPICPPASPPPPPPIAQLVSSKALDLKTRSREFDSGAGQLNN